MSTFLDSDDQETARLDEIARANPLDLSQHSPAFFEGSGAAIGTGVLSGAAKVGNLPIRAAAYIGESGYAGLLTPEGTDRFLSPADYSGLRTAGRSAVDYWAPDPATTGTAGQVLHGLAELPVPLLTGGVATLGAAQGADTEQRLVAQGVDVKTATAVGTIEGAANIAGLKVGAFGPNLLARLATSTAGNTALNAGAALAENRTLAAKGYTQQAKAYDPLDPTARSVDVIAGLFGGVAHHWAASRPGPDPVIDPQARDAALTARAAENYTDASAPGVATTVEANVAHQSAMDTAFQQVTETGQVDVAGMVNPADFVPRGTGMKDGAPVDYVAFRRALESGGDANAANPLSSALGADQFTSGTWLAQVAKEKPAWAQGLSRDEILAQRTNPDRSGEMAAALDRDNSAALATAGVESTPENLYAAHHFGPEKAIAFARATDETPVSDILSQKQILANPYLRGKTKGEVVANWYERAGVEDETSVGGGAPSMDTTAAMDAALADIPVPRTGAEAGAIIDRRLSALDEAAQAVRNPEDVRALADEAGQLEDLVREQYRARDAGTVQAPENRLTADELHFAEQRMADIRTQLEQHRLGMASAQQAERLRSSLAGAEDSDLLAISERIHPTTALATRRVQDRATLDQAVRGDFNEPMPRGRAQDSDFAPRDTFLLHENSPDVPSGHTRLYRGEHADHDRGVFATDDVNDGKVGGWFTDDKTYAESYKNTQEQVRRGPNKAGRIVYVDVPSDQLGRFDIANSGLGSDIIRQGEGSYFLPSLRSDNVIEPKIANRTETPATPAIAAADQFTAANPDAHAVVGFDADGEPQYARVSDIMDAIKADRDRAINDAKAYSAAAACALSRGLQ